MTVLLTTKVLEEDVTIVGPLSAALTVSTSGTDSDFVVKLIDVYSGDYPSSPANVARGVEMSGYQQLVRAEPFRGKYRNSFEHPEPFVPNEPDTVSFSMPDVCHCFRKGHRIMVHVQSSWFPIVSQMAHYTAVAHVLVCVPMHWSHVRSLLVQVDRNPQTFTNIYTCGEEAFVKATQRLYSGSRLEVLVM